SAAGQRKQAINIILAEDIIASKDKKAIEELIFHLDGKSKKIQYDCIKVLYEIAEHDAALLKDYYTPFIELLNSGDNRMQWGAMTALDYITALQPGPVFKSLPKLTRVAANGSIITRDHYVNILVTLSRTKKYTPTVFPLLMEEISACPVNQLPMYAEKALPVIGKDEREAFTQLLCGRLPVVEQESRRKRIQKVLSRLSR
ncbi:MAG TPA: hypothetical protein VFV68_00030, partial [Agriterribacter sp.]|nr:hypothetical protein [Agriterribacter sp.]